MSLCRCQDQKWLRESEGFDSVLRSLPLDLGFQEVYLLRKKIMGFGKTKLNLLNMHLCLASFFSLSLFVFCSVCFDFFFAQNAFLFGFLFLSFLFLRKMPLEKGSVKDNFSKKKT